MGGRAKHGDLHLDLPLLGLSSGLPAVLLLYLIFFFGFLAVKGASVIFILLVRGLLGFAPLQQIIYSILFFFRLHRNLKSAFLSTRDS